MPTIQDLFNTATGDDATVSTDQKTLDADTASDVSAHAGLVAAVIANGPTAFDMPDGSIVGLIPNPDGTITNVVFKNGDSVPVAPTTGPLPQAKKP
jgi:hypothetical protein